MKLVIKPLKTTPSQAVAEDHRDVPRPVLGAGGIYEGMISTYREESTQVSQRPHQTFHTDRNAVGYEANQVWEHAQLSSSTEATTSSWRDTFVQKTFRDVPEWIRSLILSSCVKSNLFKDSATSPKLERVVKFFGDADLRIASRYHDFGTSMCFPPSLSTSPSFDETENVHADERDFVDCVLRRMLDVAIKRYRFARRELRNIQCRQLQEMKHEDMGRVMKALREEPMNRNVPSVSSAEKLPHLLLLSEMSTNDIFALRDQLHRLSDNLSKIVNDHEHDKVSDAVPWQVLALNEMERADLETIQLERCRWTTRLEDETKILRWQYELWSIKGEVDSVVRYLVDFEKGGIDDSFPSGTDSELKPFLSTECGSTIELVDLQKSLLYRLICKFEQDHELSSHPENALDLLRSISGSSMDHDQRPNEAGVNQALVKGIEVLQEGVCNAMANMFVDDNGDDDSHEFLERTEFLQEGIRELSLILVIQEIRLQLKADSSDMLQDPKVGKLSNVQTHLNHALCRILSRTEKEIRNGNAKLDEIIPMLRRIRKLVEGKNSDSPPSNDDILESVDGLLNWLNVESEQCAVSVSMLKNFVKMLKQEQTSRCLLNCRDAFSAEPSQNHDMIVRFGSVLIDVLVKLNVHEFFVSGQHGQVENSIADHVAFWRWFVQIVLEKRVHLRESVSAAVKYAGLLSLQRKFMACRRFEYGGDNHLRKLQDEMRSIVSSMDLSATRGGDHSAQEIRSSLAVLQLQLNQLLLTQPKVQGLKLVSEPADIKEFSCEILSRGSWIARFHNGVADSLLTHSGSIAHHSSERVLLTELITNLWVDCFKQVGKKDEIERGGWMAVSSVEASHGGIRIDPSICSQLLFTARFKNVSFSHALVGRTNQFKSSMEIFRILLANLISRGLVYTSSVHLRKFLDWAVEQSLDSSCRDVPLLQWHDGLSKEEEEKLNSRLSSLTNEFPFPQLLLKMIQDLDFVGNFKLPEFSIATENDVKLRFVARVLSREDEMEWRESSNQIINCKRYRLELVSTGSLSLDMKWNSDELLSEEHVLDHVLNSNSQSYHSYWVSTTKAIDVAIKFASIFHEIGLIDVSSSGKTMKDLTQLQLQTKSDQERFFIYANRSQEVLLFKQAKLSKVFRMRIPQGCCKIWPPSHSESEKNVFPPPEDFEGDRFDEKFERHPRPIGPTKDGVHLFKWKGSGAMDERWYLLRWMKPLIQQQRPEGLEASIRFQLRSAWIANECARVMLGDNRGSKDQAVALTVLPSRLYEFSMNFDENDYCGDKLWEGTLLLFALEAGELKVPWDVSFLKDRTDSRNERENDVFDRISCEDICRFAIVDSLLGTYGMTIEDLQPVLESTSPKPFVFRMPTSWDTSLGNMAHIKLREDVSDFHDISSSVKLLEDLCKNTENIIWGQRAGWFDQGDRGKQALVKYVKDICPDCSRTEFDSTKSKKLFKVLSFMRLLDACAPAGQISVTSTYEESFRGRARLLAGLVSKLERRDFDSDLFYFNEAAKATLKDENSFKLAVLHADPLPGSSDQGRHEYDYDRGETSLCGNVAEQFCQESLQGINYNLQVGTTESLRTSLLGYRVIHLICRACVNPAGAVQLLLERRQRDGVDRMSLGIERLNVDSDLWKNLQPEHTRMQSESVEFRYIVLQLFMEGQNFNTIDLKRVFETFCVQSNCSSKLCLLLVDAESLETGAFLKSFYEALKKGASFDTAVRGAGPADFVFPREISTFFAAAGKLAPWRAGCAPWKAANLEDRSKPAQIENPSVMARQDWVGNNYSFGRNDDLCKQVAALDNCAKILVHGALFEDVCAAAYELFRFCSQRSWKGKTFLTRIEGVQGESMLKRDVVRSMCRENEDEPILVGDDGKRGNLASKGEKRFSDEMNSADDDPYDELSTMVRQSGIELYIVVDGTGLHGSKHGKLAEFLGFAGDMRHSINFGERQKVVLFACRTFKGFQGPEVRLESLGIASNGAKDYFCRAWKKLRDEDSELKRYKNSSELDSAIVAFNSICGATAGMDRWVARSLAKLSLRDLYRFSAWLQDRSDGISADSVTSFLFETLRPEEQGAFLILTVFEGRFDGSVLPKMLGKWEDCMEVGYRAILRRAGQAAEDDSDLRKKIQWAQEVSRSLIEGVNPDSKKSGSSSTMSSKHFLFADVVVEKLVKIGMVSKNFDPIRRSEERVQYALPDHVQKWGRQRIADAAKASPQFIDVFHHRRGVVAEYISEKLLEAGRQSSTSLNSSWDVHQHDWFRSINNLKESNDAIDICHLAKLLWSVTLGNTWNLVFSRFPRTLIKALAERSSALKDDLLETSTVVAFAKLEFIKGCAELEYKDKDTYETVLKILEAALDALEQNWSALAPFSVDFNNNVLDYYLCKAEILNIQGMVRSWIRKDPKEKDAIRLYDDAILSCFGGRAASDDEHILHKVLLLKIQNNRGNSLRSVGFRELKHYQKKELGKRKRGALDEIYNYFKQAEDCFEKGRELCFRQNVYNRHQQFGEKYHDIQVSRAYHNLAMCKLGMAKTLKQMEEDKSDPDDLRNIPSSCADLLRDAQENADRALAARCKWGHRGNLSVLIEALTSRVVLCNILYEKKAEDREADWKEMVSRVRRLLIDDIATLKEKKRADLMTHAQRSALRSARKEADKVLSIHRDLFQEEGVHMEDSGEEDDGRTPTNRRRGSRDRAAPDKARERDFVERVSEPASSAMGGGGGGGGDRGDAGWGGWAEQAGGGGGGPSGRGEGSGGWGGWVEGGGGTPSASGGNGSGGGGGGEGRDGGGRAKGPFFHVPVGERRYRKPDKSDQPGQGGPRSSPPPGQGPRAASSSPPPSDQGRDGGWREERRDSAAGPGGRDSWRDAERREGGGPGGRDARKDTGLANRIFAGGMRSQRPPNMPITPDMVREVFSRFGRIVDMRAGAKDFVFIDYEELDSCYKAVESMNGKSFDQHSRGIMKVSVARPFAPPPRGDRRRSRSREGRFPRPDWAGGRSRSPGRRPPGARSRSRSWSRDRGPYRSRSRSPDGPPRRSRSPPRPRSPPRDGPPRSRSPPRDGPPRPRSRERTDDRPWSRSPPPRDGPPARSWSRSPPPRGDGGGRGWRGDGPPPDRDGPWRGGGRGRGRGRGGPDGPWRGEGRGGGPDWRDGPPRDWGRDGDGFREGRGYRDGPPRDWGRDGPPRDWGREGGYRDGPPGDGFRDGPPRGGPPRFRDGPPRDGDGGPPWGGPRDRRDSGAHDDEPEPGEEPPAEADAGDDEEGSATPRVHSRGEPTPAAAEGDGAGDAGEMDMA